MRLIKGCLVLLIVLAICAHTGWANPIPVGVPYIVMTQENIRIGMDSNYIANMTGKYIFSLVRNLTYMRLH